MVYGYRSCLASAERMRAVGAVSLHPAVQCDLDARQAVLVFSRAEQQRGRPRLGLGNEHGKATPTGPYAAGRPGSGRTPSPYDTYEISLIEPPKF